MNRIQTIIDKEWAEVFKNRLVLFTVGFLPLVFTALPLGILYATRAVGVSDGDVPMPVQQQIGATAADREQALAFAELGRVRQPEHPRQL
ncbi:MAG: hypothetical protein L0099_08780, partial [Acidobacteria bacterium]|nr:hypothetical protein [Acidobacteriota bacterium]